MSEDKHIIWSNYDLDYEDWRGDLETEYPELSEDERISLMYEINGHYLDDERMNLNVQLSQPILVVGDLGLWNGRRMGYKEIPSGNIRDCLYSDTDYSTWYVDRLGDLRCRVRAVTNIETLPNGKSRIVVTELPYLVNKARLIEKIAELVRDKKIDGITDLNDHSSREGMRICIDLRPDISAEPLD